MSAGCTAAGPTTETASAPAARTTSGLVWREFSGATCRHTTAQSARPDHFTLLTGTMESSAVQRADIPPPQPARPDHFTLLTGTMESSAVQRADIPPHRSATRWLGLERVHLLTTSGVDYRLRLEWQEAITDHWLSTEYWLFHVTHYRYYYAYCYYYYYY